MTDYFDLLEHSKVRFGYRLAVLSNWYRGPANKTIDAKFHLTDPETAVLFCIGHADRLTATDVCNISGRPKNSISRAIASLINKNLLGRSADLADARRKRLALSAKGRTLFEKVMAIFVKREQDVLQPLTPSELSDLDRLLRKMTRHFVDKEKTY